MLAALSLIGCLTPAARVSATDPSELVVHIVARVLAPAAPAAWEASATSEGVARERLMPGECVSVPDGPTRPLPQAVKSLRLQGAIEGTLLLGTDAWRTAGGLRTADPAWTVADLRWSRGDALGERTLSRAVRFGPSPKVTAVFADSAGLHLRWDVLSVEEPEIALTGPDGELRCGTGSAGVVLPHWTVADGGVVRLRSTHTHSEEASANLRVKVRATIERLIPLDESPAEVAPSALPPAPVGPALGPIRGGRERPTRG